MNDINNSSQNEGSDDGGGSSSYTTVNFTNIIEIWKTTINVQKHFNDLSLRIRNIALTILGAFLTISAFSLKEKIFIDLLELHVPLASILIFLAFLIWVAFYIMDRYWYHILLIGAVKHGLFIEEIYSNKCPEMGLSKAIKEESGKQKFQSSRRLTNFYLWIGAVLLLLSSIIFFSFKSDHKNENLISTNEHMVLATLWTQISGENKALQYQAFNVAKSKIENYLNENKMIGNEAVIVDIDETILETSLYQAEIITENKYFPEDWSQFKAKANCNPTAGAVEFLNYLDQSNINIFYVSNRPSTDLSSVMKNLNLFGFPQVSNSNILLKQKSNSKTTRRDSIRKNFNVLLLLGDSLGDFSDIFSSSSNDERNQKVLANKMKFGDKFIVFPNVSYGEWESLIAKDYFKLSPDERNNKRKQLIKKLYAK